MTTLEPTDPTAFARDPEKLAEEITAIAHKRRAEVVALKAPRAKPPPSPNPDEALSGTEDEVAIEFSRQNSEILRYVNPWHRWVRWNGVLWRRIEDLSVFHQVRLLARQYAKLNNDKKLARDAATASIERAARNDPRHDTSVEAWDLGLRAFHTPNRNTTE